MSIRYTRRDWELMAATRRHAFEAIAKKLGKDHAITKMMGSRAWGRHRHEQGVDGNLAGAIMDMASLEGAFDVLNEWARDHSQDAQRIMLSLWPRRFESAATPPATGETP